MKPQEIFWMKQIRHKNKSTAWIQHLFKNQNIPHPQIKDCVA